MGAWGTGAFDNDDAADFAGDLNDADPGERPGLIREALEAAADNDDYLAASTASAAIAAAAVVASQQPDGPEVDSVYGPEFLTDGDSVDLPEEFPIWAYARSPGSCPTSPSGVTCGRTPARSTRRSARWSRCGPRSTARPDHQVSLVG